MASLNTKTSACNSIYLRALTDSDNNNFFLHNVHHLEVPIAIPFVYSDDQMFYCYLLMVPESKVPVSLPHQKHRDPDLKAVFHENRLRGMGQVYSIRLFSGLNLLGLISSIFWMMV
jgi:hypothetical protein